MRRGSLAVVLLLLASRAETAPDVALVRIATGLTNVTAIAHAPDGTSRLFIVLQGGIIRVYKGGALLAGAFLDISPLVSCCGEQGLLGLAFHPQYSSNGYFFVHYTDVNGDTVLARYKRSSDADVADASSAVVVLQADQPFDNHNGGQVAFGPDGYLFLALGDGGSGGDPQNNAQTLSSLLGKLLRIAPDVASDNPSPPYTVPPDNPFVSSPPARPEVWAYGLRNPWRFSFDRSLGDLFIGDVGQARVEEIDFAPFGSGAGWNYGWRLMEGSLCFEPPSGCDPSSLRLPILEHSHDTGDCSVTGGYRYRGGQVAQLHGSYVYGDFCSGRIYRGLPAGPGWSSSTLLPTPHLISTFGEDELGELYVARYGNAGDVYKLVERSAARRTASFDADHKTDHAVYHAGSGLWYVRASTTGATSATGFGGAGFSPAPGDYDGDGRTDMAVYHEASGLWYVRRSSTGATSSLAYGGQGYVPVARDYDGDGLTDVAVYHPASGLWFVLQSSTGTTFSLGFGGDGFAPVARDYDGDGRADVAVYHEATGLWYVRLSSTGATFSGGFGGPGFSPVPRDFDGDGRSDLAVYHRASGVWYFQRSSTGVTETLGFGGAEFDPVPGDFDGDGRADLAVYHRTAGLWYVRYSTTGATLSLGFGGSGFAPVSEQ